MTMDSGWGGGGGGEWSLNVKAQKSWKLEVGQDPEKEQERRARPFVT